MPSETTSVTLDGHQSQMLADILALPMLEDLGMGYMVVRLPNQQAVLTLGLAVFAPEDQWRGQHNGRAANEEEWSRLLQRDLKLVHGRHC